MLPYHLLWHWQKEACETEWREKRPCCVTIIVKNAQGQHVLFIAPITSKSPTDGRLAIEMPETEARRAGLDTVTRLWVMVDELNADILEASYVLEDRSPMGQFSSAFTDIVRRQIKWNIRLVQFQELPDCGLKDIITSGRPESALAPEFGWRQSKAASEQCREMADATISDRQGCIGDA